MGWKLMVDSFAAAIVLKRAVFPACETVFSPHKQRKSTRE
jgi:hypothetical protein